MKENTSSFQLNMNLSLEQKFRMRVFQESIQAMNPDEARYLLAEASKLLMVKDNIIKSLIKQDLAQ